MNDKALKLIAELEEEMAKDIFSSVAEKNKEAADCANLGRMGALQLAILKIKVAFDIPII